MSTLQIRLDEGARVEFEETQTRINQRMIEADRPRLFSKTDLLALALWESFGICVGRHLDKALGKMGSAPFLEPKELLSWWREAFGALAHNEKLPLKYHLGGMARDHEPGTGPTLTVIRGGGLNHLEKVSQRRRLEILAAHYPVLRRKLKLESEPKNQGGDNHVA